MVMVSSAASCAAMSVSSWQVTVVITVSTSVNTAQHRGTAPMCSVFQQHSRAQPYCVVILSFFGFSFLDFRIFGAVLKKLKIRKNLKKLKSKNRNLKIPE